MATIASFLCWRHLRADPSFHVLHYKGGHLAKSGRGLAFWFFPLSASVAKVPMEDRELPFAFNARSSDFQELTAQGALGFRVAEPEKLVERVDFSVDLDTGHWNKTPLDQLSELIAALAKQVVCAYLERGPLRELLGEGIEPLRARLREALALDPTLRGLGIELTSVRVSSLAPSAELERALQAPMREAIQQQSDEATFQRRALAVEKERAIQENELQNRIEIARREEQLIAQVGQNELKRATEEAEAKRIEAEAAAVRLKLERHAEAEGIRAVESAKVETELARMDIYRELPTQVMVGLAAQELASNLKRIDHLNLSPDALGPLLTNLVGSATKKLES